MNRTLDLSLVAFLIVFSVVNADTKSGIGQEREGANDYRTSPAILARPNRWGLTSNDFVELFKRSDTVAICSGAQVRIVNLVTGRVIRRIDVGLGEISKAAISGDDRILALLVKREQSYSTVVINLPTGEIVDEFEMPENNVGWFSFCINSNGKTLLCSRQDAELLYINIASREVARKYIKASIEDVAFGNNSEIFAVLNREGRLTVWNEAGELKNWTLDIKSEKYVPLIQFSNEDKTIEIFGSRYWRFELERDREASEQQDANRNSHCEIERQDRLVKVRNLGEQKPCEIELFDTTKQERINECKVLEPQIAIRDVSVSGRFIVTQCAGYGPRIFDLTNDGPTSSSSVLALHFLPGANRIAVQHPTSIEIWQEREQSYIHLDGNFTYVESIYDPELNEVLVLSENRKSLKRVSVDKLRVEKDLMLSKFDKRIKFDSRDIFGKQLLLTKGQEIQVALLMRSMSLFSSKVIEEAVILTFDRVSGEASNTFRFAVKAGVSDDASGKGTGKEANTSASRVERRTTLKVFPDQVAFLSSGDKLSRLDLKDNSTTSNLTTDGIHLRPNCLSNQGEFLLATDDSDGTVNVIDIEKMEVVNNGNLGLGKFPVIQLIDDENAIANNESEIVFFDSKTLIVQHRVRGNFQDVAVSPDKLHLAIAGSDGALAIESIAELRKKAKWEVPAE